MAPVPKSWIVRTLSQKPASRSGLIHKIKNGSGSPGPGLCGRWTPLRQRFAPRGGQQAIPFFAAQIDFRRPNGLADALRMGRADVL